MNKYISTLIAFTAGSFSAFGAVVSLTDANFPGVITAADANSDGINEYYVDADLTLSAANEYIIEQLTFVRNGATLTIPAGTVLRGQPVDSTSGANLPGALIVTTTGKIDAVGTAGNPIVFTTAALDDGSGNVLRPAAGSTDATRYTGTGTFLDADPKNSPLPITLPNGESAYQLWGGVVILGEAPTNSTAGGSDGLGFIEGLPSSLPGVFGGVNPNDDSGNLVYVSIRHTGFGIAPNSELQGLTLGGVGFGTNIQFIDIYGSSDDGIEIFGGTVNLKYININFADDDGLDLDQGYTGLIQYCFVLGASGNSYDSLGEWDGDDESATGSPVTSNYLPLQYPVMRNMTLIGQNGSRGIRMRNNFGGEFLDSIVFNVSANAIAIDNSSLSPISALDRYNAGTLIVNGVTFDTATGFNPASVESFGVNKTGGTGILAINDTVANGVNPVPFQDPADALAALVVLPSIAGQVPATATFFDVTSYRGAFNPVGSALLWTTGWTALNKRGILVDRGDDR